MAEESDSGDKTEEPTARRLQKGREEGQIARSTELTSAVVTIGAMVYLFVAGTWIVDHLRTMFSSALIFDRRLLFSELLTPGTLLEIAGFAFLVFIPLFLLTIVLALLGGSATGGFVFAMKAAAPKASKMNPLKGLKRIFGLKALVELGKAVAKFLLVGGTVVVMFMVFMTDLVRIGMMEYEPGLAQLGLILAVSSLIASLTLLVIAAIDVPFQKYEFTKQMRMSLKEVRDEMKEVEGNPHVRAKIRQRQQQIAASRMMAKVKEADVIVTNPEHFAVALSYDPEGDSAPQVLAKGVDAVALNIRREARAHGVREFRAPELARALYYTTELNGYIPELLYLPVAQVIAYIFNLEAKRAGQPAARKPRPKVPREMQFDPQGRPLNPEDAS